MKRLAIFSLLFLLGLPGCSFRMPSPQAGEISSMQVSPGGVNSLTRIRAIANFTGAMDTPSLSIVQGTAEGTIRLMAFGNPAQHFMGLGVMPVDRTSTHTYELETSLVLTKPGTYQIEGLSGEDLKVTAITTLQVAE